MNKKQGYDWNFKVSFTLPTNESSVEGDRAYFIMKASATDADSSAVVNTYTSLTDSGNLSGTAVSVNIEIPAATTKGIELGDYVAEFYWYVAGATVKRYPIAETQYITVIDAVKDVPA